MSDYRDYPPVFNRAMMWRAVEIMNRNSDTLQARTSQVVMDSYHRLTQAMGYREPPRMVEIREPLIFRADASEVVRALEGLVERPGAAIVHQDV